MKRRPRKSVCRPCLEGLEARMMLAGDLRITELNYNPHDALPQFGDRDVDADEFEFIEVTNVGDQPLDLGGYRISQGVRFQFDTQFLNAGDRLVIVKDKGVFRTRFGEDVELADGDDGENGKNGEFGGNLNNDGEVIELRDALDRIVQKFEYFDSGKWPRRANGQGSSLELSDLEGNPNDPRSWRASSEFGGSPGWAGEGFRGDVVINELLTHTDLPEVDAIELHNRTSQPINTAGWYISDSAANLFRYRIGDVDAVLRPQDYQTYDEDQLGFGFRGQAPDNAFLVEPDSTGKPIRFVDSVTYNATQNGNTLGRWANGVGELFPMTENTLGDANSGPLISEVIISEVQYHPAPPAPGSVLSEDDLEFIEIYNRTGSPINIGLWRINDYAANELAMYTFPENTILPAGETLIVMGFNPANVAKRNEFVATYRIPDSIPLLGPYSDAAYDPNPDQLGNNGDTVLLERPEDLAQLGLGYVLEDRVIYSNTAPWPEGAAGTGLSLTRAYRNRYGDFPQNWQAVMPTPGRPWLPGDVNGDGQVDDTDIDMSCAAVHQGGDTIRYDHNRDGVVNLDDMEFLIFEILDTTIGDANLDGFFDSADFVHVFVAGKYENDIPNSAGWAEGDWNCDGVFDSGDFVAAFQTGDYESAPASPPQAVSWNPASVAAAFAPLLSSDADHGSDNSSLAPSVSSNSAQVAARPTQVDLEPTAPLDAVFAEGANFRSAEDVLTDPPLGQELTAWLA